MKLEILILTSMLACVLLFIDSHYREIQTLAFDPDNLSSISRDSVITNNTISPVDSPASFLSYVNDKFGIRMQYPSTWEAMESGVWPIPPDSSDDIVRFQPKSESQASVTLTVEKLDPIPTIAEYLNESIATEEDASGAKILVSNMTTLAGRPGYFIMSTYAEDEQGVDIWKKIEIGTIVGNLGYAITFDSPSLYYAKDYPYVQKMIDSLRFASASNPVPVTEGTQQPT